MGTSYKRADRETEDLVSEVAEKHHPELCTEGVKYDLLFAYGAVDEGTGFKVDDALKKNGLAALALIRVVNLRDRAKGCGDAEIRIDADRWPEFDDAQKWALIDHELEHLVLCRDRELEVKRDDLSRPKLKLRPHDFEIGGFVRVIRRHGDVAFEARSVKSVAKGLRQLELFSEEEWKEVEDNFADSFRTFGMYGAKKRAPGGAVPS